MGLNSTRKHLIEARRRQVAELRLRGSSLDDITRVLATQLVNPDTKKPYGRDTIYNDLKFLSKRWISEAHDDYDEHKARQFAEIQKVKQQAWLDKNPALALRSLELEMKLLGTLAPLNINIVVITKLVQAIEARGMKASDVFEAMMQELAMVDDASD